MSFCSGGTLTAQDLAGYRVTVTDAWKVPLGEYQMFIPPPPAGGILLSLILNIMKGSDPHKHLNTKLVRHVRNIKDVIGSFTGYDLKPAALSAEQKTLTYHHYVEAFKFANGLKKHIRDPKFSSEDVSASSETLWLNTSVLF